MKHARTKATEISMKTKKEVWERDKHCCIFCGKPIDVNQANAHYIKRSQGGLGIAQNIFSACCECHWQEDFGQNQDKYRERVRRYLSSKYENWNEKNLYYDKWR